MRFLVQHLRDFGAILRRAATLLRPGGALVIIESDLARSQVLLPPRSFLAMLLAYHRASALEGGLKTRLLGALEPLIAETGGGWHLAAEREAITARVGPFGESKLIEIFRRWIDLAERSAMFPFDFDAVRAELSGWGEERASFVSLSTRIFVLKP